MSSQPSSALPIPRNKPDAGIQLLDEHEVSKRLSVSVNTLRYWRACGEGPNYVKLGRLVRYDAGALEKFLLRNLRVSKTRATAEEKRVAL
jgi:predicted DNA-binding transcriptional regulator AlpA